MRELDQELNMFAGFMASLIEIELENPMLAGDFSVWLAGCSWNWKPKRFETTTKETASKKGAASSKDKIAELPTPPVSPHQAFIESISRTPYSTSSTITPPSLSPLFTTEFFAVKPSPKKGLGAFAIKDIAKGTVILSEKPLFRANTMEVYYTFENLTPKERKEFKALACYREVDPDKINAIWKTDRFEIAGGRTGIFLKSARFNHTCHPYATCTYSFNKGIDRLVITTLLDIEAGQEITISYCGYDAPTSLPDNYGFYCDCPNCPTPEEAAVRAKLLAGAQ